jgi:hypothetical protein
MQLITQIETRHRPEVIGLITRIAHLQRFNRGDKFLLKASAIPASTIKRFAAAQTCPVF